MSAITLTLDPRNRLTLTTTIERLINLLDAMEPDPDLEPYLAGWLAEGDAGDDREFDLDATEGDGDADKEFSLGWPEKCSQGHDEAARQGFPLTRGCDVIDELPF